MGVFRKLKDVLFDVEEDDFEPTQVEEKKEVKPEIKKEKPVIKENENTITEIKIPKEEPTQMVTKKAEQTFNFPLEIEEDVPTRRSRNYDDDFLTPPKKRSNNDYSRSYDVSEPKKDNVKPFKATPIISPVYGILDQNYSKDDVVVKSEAGAVGLDLETVRKKVYGIEPAAPKKTEIKPEPVSAPPADGPAPAVKFELIEEPKEDTTFEPLENSAVQLKDGPEEKEYDFNNEDTLETDLFKLIDSMYEDKEEEEEQ